MQPIKSNVSRVIIKVFVHGSKQTAVIAIAYYYSYSVNKVCFRRTNCDLGNDETTMAVKTVFQLLKAGLKKRVYKEIFIAYMYVPFQI